MKTYLKVTVLFLFCCLCSINGMAEANLYSWRAYDLNTGETASGQKLYRYLDLVGFGQWRDGKMVGCNPGGKGEYVYLVTSPYEYDLLYFLYSHDDVDFYWRNTGDGDWDDEYILQDDGDVLTYCKRRRPGSDMFKDMDGWMRIVDAYNNAQGQYVITLDNIGIARKFKVIITKQKRK